MKKKYINQILLLFVALLIICLLLPKSYTEEDAYNELLKLDSKSSMEQLKQKGYIDVSQTMETQNSEITDFIDDTQSKRACVLRIATIHDTKLYAKILVYNKDFDAIVMHTFYPNQQQGENPGKCFNTTIKKMIKNGVVIIYLKNIPNPSIPFTQTLEDEILYSYYFS